MRFDEGKLSGLPGRCATRAEVVELQLLVAGTPDDVLGFIAEYPIIGVAFSLSENDDESGMGVEMRVLSPSEAIDEAKMAYPGISAVQRGYLPFGMCLAGSGDPYFVHCPTQRLVRIPHDAAIEDQLDESSIEVVASSVRRFFQLAEPYPTTHA
jgi:hypothetical protein